MAQLDAIVALVRRVLGDDALGAYLHGSAVLGRLRPRSDTDVLVVSRRPMTAGERRALVDGILDLSGRRARLGPDRPIELAIVVQGDVRPWRYPPRCELLYGEWLRDGLVYLGEEADRWDDLAARVRPHADFVVHEIARAVTVGPGPAGSTP